MNYIEAPNEFCGSEPAVFLAGGISDTENWQLKLVEMFDCEGVTLLNPRRHAFPKIDPIAHQTQIEWEHRHLSIADLVVFWFPAESLCPIALFELGTCCESGVPLVVGTDANYARRFDVVVQLKLRRPEVCVVDSLEALSSGITEQLALLGSLS